MVKRKNNIVWNQISTGQTSTLPPSVLIILTQTFTDTCHSIVNNRRLTEANWQSSGLSRSRTCWRFWMSFFFLGINLNSFFSRGLTRSFRPFIWCSTQDRVASILSVSPNSTMAYTPCECKVTVRIYCHQSLPRGCIETSH